MNIQVTRFLSMTAIALFFTIPIMIGILMLSGPGIAIAAAIQHPNNPEENQRAFGEYAEFFFKTHLTGTLLGAGGAALLISLVIGSLLAYTGLLPWCRTPKPQTYRYKRS